MIDAAGVEGVDAVPDRPFLVRDALRGGLSEKTLRSLVEGGWLRRPFKGVLVRADRFDTLEARAEAAGLVLPDGAALCRTTAAWLFGLDARPPGTHTADPPPDLQISLADEHGTEVRRLDLGYRERRYGLEYDGEEYHGGLDFEAADRRRRDEIDRRWSWTVVGVGKNLVLGPAMAVEYAVGELLGMEPLNRRRQW